MSNRDKYLEETFWESVKRFPWVLETWWDKLRWFCFPRNKWIMKNIPNHWADKDTIIETVLFDCIIHYVEDERGLGGGYKDINDNIKEIYQWAKYDRDVKCKELAAAYPPIPSDPSDVIKIINKDAYDQEYRELHRIEKFITEKDTEYLGWIVKNREYIWT